MSDFHCIPIFTFIIFTQNFCDIQCKLIDPELTTIQEAESILSHGIIKEKEEKRRGIGFNVPNIPVQWGHANSSEVISHLRSHAKAECLNQYLICDTQTKFRTINGTCNNIERPYLGSSSQPYSRLLVAEYSDGVSEPRGGRHNSSLPNPRLVSTKVHRDVNKPTDYITNLLPIFGIFVDHDMSHIADEDKRCCSGDTDTDCWPIPIYQNDSFYSQYDQTCMDYTRSTAYCNSANGVRAQYNTQTAYIDLSNLYGPDDLRNSYMRTNDETGRLRVSKTDKGDLLPTVAEVEEELNVKVNIRGEFFAGDDRVNEMPTVTAMYILFLREHNRIATEIRRRQPQWNGERIFQESRRIVIAEYQNVIYKEYLPLILGPDRMSYFTLRNDSPTKYDRRQDSSILNAFAASANQFSYTNIARTIFLVNGTTSAGSYRVRDTYFDTEIIKQNGGEGFGYLLNGLIQQKAQYFDQFVIKGVTNFFLRNKTMDFGTDVVARIIQRERDHGIPSYIEFVRFCSEGQIIIRDLSDLVRYRLMRQEDWQVLSELYDSPGAIDLFTGGLSEIRLDNAVVGPTLACLIGLQFRYLKFGDKFFFNHREKYGSFSFAQLNNIKRRTLRDIICDNTDVPSTAFNVFVQRSSCGGSNPRKSCGASRPSLNFDVLVPPE